MKRTFALFVATLVFVAASSLQAAEAQFQVFSQTEGQRLKVANDVHYSIVDGEGQKVTDGANAYEFSVELSAGEYSVVVEQGSTNFAGSLNVVVGETNPIRLLKLDRNGLSEINDAHACPESHNGLVAGESCDHDKDCICHRVNSQCDPNGLYNPANGSSTNVPTTLSNSPMPTNSSLPQVPSYPSSAPMGYGASMGGGMGSLAILGAIGAVIAVAVTDNDKRPPHPVTSMYRYR